MQRLWPPKFRIDDVGEYSLSVDSAEILSESACLRQPAIHLHGQPEGWKITIDSAIETGRVEFFVPTNPNAPLRIVCDSRAESRSKPFEELLSEGHYAAAADLAERELQSARQRLRSVDFSSKEFDLQQVISLECRTLVKSLQNVAIASIRKGDYQRAESVLREAIPICELAPDQYAETLIRLMHDQIHARYLYRCADEESIFEVACDLSRAIKRSEKLLGREHLETARLLTTHARLLISEFSYLEAEELLAEAIRIRTIALGAEHRDVAESMLELARLNAYRDSNDEAAEGFRRVLAIREAQCGVNHPDVAEVLFHYSDFFMYNRKDSTKAGPLLRRALEIWNDTSGLNHPLVARESSFIRKVFSVEEASKTEIFE